jgi:hypothetical protein
MAARAAVALALAALAWAGSARAEDDPACAQYREPMAYNACLARHGPKANGVGTLSRHSQPQPGRIRNGWTYGRGPTTRFYDTQGSQRIHGRVHMEFRVH